MRCHFCGKPNQGRWCVVACDDCNDDPDLTLDIEEEERMAQEEAETEALEHLEDVRAGRW